MSLTLSEPLVPTCACEHHPDSLGEGGSWGGVTDQTVRSNLFLIPKPCQLLASVLAQPCTPVPQGLSWGDPQASHTHQAPQRALGALLSTCFGLSAWLRGDSPGCWSPAPGTCVELETPVALAYHSSPVTKCGPHPLFSTSLPFIHFPPSCHQQNPSPSL